MTQPFTLDGGGLNIEDRRRACRAIAARDRNAAAGPWALRSQRDNCRVLTYRSDQAKEHKTPVMRARGQSVIDRQRS